MKPRDVDQARRVASGDRAGHGGHHAAVHAEMRVELADVVQQRGGEPPGIVGVLGAGEAHLDVARDADGVALVVVGLPAELHEARRA